MDLSRRSMLHAGAALPLIACVRRNTKAASETIGAVDGHDWEAVRSQFDLEPGAIYLDSGWSPPPPRVVTRRFDTLMRDLRRMPAYHLEHLQDDHARTVYAAVAGLLGVPENELALTRNATEGLATVLLGLPLETGDEIVCAQTDYWHMLRMLETRAATGATVRMVELPVPAPDPQAIVEAYAAAINDRTRLVLLTHVSNVTGQTMPVREIAALAHRRGAQVVVDAAQSLAVLDHRVPDLDCDYYAASLHKWLMAPLGTGVLWTRPELAKALPSRFDAGAGTPGMYKFSEAGMVSIPAFVPITEAVTFHRQIGAARKEARLRTLTTHLRERLAEIPDARFFTAAEPWAGCAILALETRRHSPREIANAMWERHRIVVQPVEPKWAPQLRGIRFTPSVHNTIEELDRAARAVTQLMRSTRKS